MPDADHGCELVGAGGPSVATDMEWEFIGQQPLHIAEVLPVPALLEYHTGDVDRIHAATVAKPDRILSAAQRPNTGPLIESRRSAKAGRAAAVLRIASRVVERRTGLVASAGDVFRW